VKSILADPVGRLDSRALLLLAFSLLATAATAHAECAWVLWFQMKAGSSWQIERAFQTESACREAEMAYSALIGTCRGLCHQFGVKA